MLHHSDQRQLRTETPTETVLLNYPINPLWDEGKEQNQSDHG